MIKIIGQNDELFERVALSAYSVLELSGNASVELIYLDEDEMRKLNFETRQIDKSTDVLSYPNLTKIMPFTEENYPFDFDIENKNVFLGSVVICESIAKQQAEEYGHSVLREKAYLFLHGLLHLLGYDHMEEDDKKVMRAREEEILSKVGATR